MANESVRTCLCANEKIKMFQFLQIKEENKPSIKVYENYFIDQQPITVLRKCVLRSIYSLEKVKFYEYNVNGSVSFTHLKSNTKPVVWKPKYTFFLESPSYNFQYLLKVLKAV